MMKDSESLLASFESMDHRLVPEAVMAVSNDEFPIQNQVEAMEDRYEIVEEIARGGQKQVFVARDQVTDREVALATLHGTATALESEAFLREARLHASLVHPNVVRVYDLGILPDGRAFFTMTLMTGHTLADLIEEQRPLSELLDVFLGICNGIAYAHDRKVLHLDLKPQNIQVGRFGNVFISDWGLAHVGDQAAAEVGPDDSELDPDLLNHFTLSGTIKGTPGYMAPEQASGGSATVATDVYGLGAVLYAILTGGPVVEAENTKQCLQKTACGNLPKPEQRAPDREIPHALSAVCMRALSNNPDDRYPDVSTLRKEIVRYRDGFATEAQDAGFLDHARLLVMRHKVPTALIVAFLGILIATTGTFIGRLSQSQQAALSARDTAVKLQEEAERAEADTAATLEALQTARKEQAQLSGMFSNWLLEDSQTIYEEGLVSKGTQFRFAAVKERIDAAIAQAPNNPEVLLQKALIDLIFQDFSGAKRALDKLDASDVADLQTVVDDLAQRQTAGEASKQLTIRAIRNLPKQRDMLARYVFLNAAAIFSRADRPEYVTAMITRENPGLQNFVLRYDNPEGRQATVDLSGYENLTTIEFETPPHDHSLLYRLNPMEVDLSDTGVSAIKSLQHINRLKRLKLAGAPIRDLDTLLKIANLEYVQVDQHQVQKVQLLGLRPRVIIDVRRNH